jgi:hypothetical protein
MKFFKKILLVSMAFSLNANYAINNANTIETLHAHDVKFSVFVKNGEQLLNGATAKVLINNVEVAAGTSNEVGNVDLLVKSYKHEKATIIVSYDRQTKTINNVTLVNGKFYYADFAVVDVIDFEKFSKEKTATAGEVKISQSKTEKAKLEVDSQFNKANKLKKREVKYKKKLSKINKSQRKIDKVNVKLDKSQKMLDAKEENISEDAEFLKVKDRQLRIDKQRNKYNMRQLKLDKKLKKLNKMYNK